MQISGFESKYSAGYFLQNTLVRGTKQGFGDQTNPINMSGTSYNYNDEGRIVKVSTDFGLEKKDPRKRTGQGIILEKLLNNLFNLQISQQATLMILWVIQLKLAIQL